MIRLDFHLIDPLGSLPPERVSTASEADFAVRLFESSLIFLVNDADLSWDERIPMVHFAYLMFAAATTLNRVPEQSFISADLEPWWRFRLHDSHVTVCRQSVDVSGECSYGELLQATAAFGVRVYERFIATFPNAVANTFLTRHYPYRAMQELSVSAE